MEANDVANEVAQEYASSLADLTVNSKPLINMLTMLAEENSRHASAIVQAVEKHLIKVEPEYKLPVLYLIDSIVKNVGPAYTNLFTQNIVSTFCGVFEKVDERTRAQMFKLRQTWNEMFPSKKLYAIDVRVASIDPAWPVTAPVPSIHINPKFLGKKSEGDSAAVAKPEPVALPASTLTPVAIPAPAAAAVKVAASELEQSKLTEARMREELLRKQKELLDLQQKKIELEYLQAKTRLEEQQRQMLQKQAAMAVAVSSVPGVEASKAQTMLLGQLNAARLLADQQKSKTGAAQPTTKFQVTTAAPTPKTLPQTPSSEAVQKPSVQQPILAKVHKFEPSDSKSDAIVPNVPTDLKSKCPLLKHNVSVSSTSNKDIIKSSFKDTFLNKDPRTANKRISPVPKSMAMLAAQVKDRISSSNHDNLPISAKSSTLKQKPSSPTKVKKALSPLKSIPEIPVPSPADASKLSSSSGSGSETKVSVKSLPDGKSSSQLKKELGRIPKKSSNVMKSDRSPKIERKLPTIPKYSDAKSSLTKSQKDSSKFSKKGLDSKKKDRKRDTDSVSENKISTSKSKSDVKSGRAFKDTKSFRGRNYIRRKRSVSESPEPPSESGDVDLRTSVPSDARVAAFKDEPDALNAKPGMSPPGPPFQIEGNKVARSASPDLLGKDVDLRQLPTSPVSLGKKRSSSIEKTDHPSPKKSKAEMIDVLFGNEDVDLRQLAPPPQAMDLPIEELKEQKKAPDWARFKEVNPDTYKSPLKNSSWETSSEHGSHVSDIEIQPPPPPPKISGEPPIIRVSPLARSVSKEKPAFDRLGRPLLYNRLSVDDPRERRRSMSSQSTGEDTDMRHNFVDAEPVDEVDSNPMNINIIISQADEQLRDGTISIGQYNSLLKQMVHLNEVQKLREAQRRDEQEGWDGSGSDSWDHEHSRSDDDKDSDKSRDGDRGSPRRDGKYRRFSKDSDGDGSGRYNKSGAHGDIDERFASHPSSSGVRDGCAGRGRVRGGLSSHPHAPVTRPWPDNGPAGPRPPHWEEPAWHSGPHARQMGARPGLPGPGMPPHHMHGPRPPFARGRGDFGPRYPQWQPDHFNQAGPYPFNGNQNRFRPPFKGELEAVDPRELEVLEQDSMKTINIDTVPREIRYYGDTAIIMMKWDDPRELSFQAGTRRVIFNDCDSFACSFGDKYREIVLDGMLHSIRLGAPTRELFIDGRWYECFFGGPPIQVELDGKRHRVHLDGPPPQVKIGVTRRTDLVAGKINLIIDARHMVPIFLDPKPQKFVIDGKPHILRFVEAFRTAIINGKPFKVNFGGLPMPIMVRDQKHFIGFSALPPGIRPGYIHIANMEGGRLASPSPADEGGVEQEIQHPQQPKQQPQLAIPKEEENQGHMPAMPMIGSSARGRPKQFQRSKSSPSNSDANRSSPEPQSGEQGLKQGQLDVLSSLMPGAVTAATGFSYQVQQEQATSEKQPPQSGAAAAEDSKVGITAALNIGELLSKLVATGILPSGETAETKKEDDSKTVKPVTLTPDSLKLRQAGIFSVLYSGIQCSSCGVRFPPEQTMKYSQHLDWHFRHNRRERDSAKKAQSRKWYYDVSDWIQFEEIEDLEERAQSWFETQVIERPEEKEQELQSVPAGDNSENIQCAMCHESFEQFYNEDKEEWHLRDAIRVEDKTYHPVCYEDYKNALEASLEESMTQAESQETEEVKGEVKGEDGAPCEDVAVPKEEGVLAAEDAQTEDDKQLKQETQEVDMADIKLEEGAGESAMETTPSEEVAAAPKDESIGVVIKQEPMDTSEVEPQAVLEPTNGETQDDSAPSVKIKSEPLDVDEENERESMDIDESSNVVASVDTTSSIVTSSIDGNVELEETAPVSVATGKIKINISKFIAPTPAPAPVERRSDSETSQTEHDADSDSETSATPSTTLPSSQTCDGPKSESSPPPPPPGEDSLLLKPRLVGRKLTEMPPVFKGTELSGLCSIM